MARHLTLKQSEDVGGAPSQWQHSMPPTEIDEHTQASIQRGAPMHQGVGRKGVGSHGRVDLAHGLHLRQGEGAVANATILGRVKLSNELIHHSLPPVSYTHLTLPTNREV